LLSIPERRSRKSRTSHRSFSFSDSAPCSTKPRRWLLRTQDEEGTVRETRLWVIDYEGAPWVVTARNSEHVRQLTAKPRVELFRRGQARCYLAEPHGDRETIEDALRLRREKYWVQRVAVALGVWPGSRDDLEAIAVAVRFDPCPAIRGELTAPRGRTAE
jgi:hypothetical protein